MIKINEKSIPWGLVIGLFITVFCFSAFLDDTWGLYVAFTSGILVMIVLGVLFPGWLIIVPICKDLFSYKKIYPRIIAYMIIAGFIITIAGGVTAFTGVGFDQLYEVDQVQIAKIEKNKIIIDYTRYNNEDYTTKEIKKPIYLIEKVESQIYVRYPENKPEKMHYILGPKKGGIIAITGILLGLISILLYLRYKETSKAKK